MVDNKYFDIEIAGCKRKLPLCEVNKNLDIAAFIMFGDTEITEKSAKKLLEMCPKFDVLITAESKGIPLCYEMAKQCGKKYIVARKSQKVYMKNSIHVEVKSITTSKMQKLYLSENDFSDIKDKKVLLIDDVISTGESLSALEKLVEKAGGIIVSKACVLAEGSSSERTDIIYLEKLPLFPK